MSRGEGNRVPNHVMLGKKKSSRTPAKVQPQEVEDFSQPRKNGHRRRPSGKVARNGEGKVFWFLSILRSSERVRKDGRVGIRVRNGSRAKTGGFPKGKNYSRKKKKKMFIGKREPKKKKAPLKPPSDGNRRQRGLAVGTCSKGTDQRGEIVCLGGRSVKAKSECLAGIFFPSWG